MVRISDWYSDLGEHSFPTLFLRLGDAEAEALLAGAEADRASAELIGRLQKALRAFNRSAFVGTDVCAPTDSPRFRPGRWVSFGRTAWRLLSESVKVCEALRAGHTDRVIVRPFRRMDRTREFRMFLYGRRFAGMSQYRPGRHLSAIAKRETEILGKGRDLAGRIAEHLPAENIVVDVYLCSDGHLLVVDMNDWGLPTEPLLMRTWDRDWSIDGGLKLVPKPTKMGGEISVSF